MKRAALALCAALLAACSGQEEPPAAPVPAPEVPALDPVAAMNAATDALMARPEVSAPVITVQHCLIAVEGILPGVTRSREEAERLTAELFAQLQAGADFDQIIKAHSGDEYPGLYSMSLGEPPREDVHPREAMTLALGDVGWRLSVGEIGIARYDGERFDVEAKSPFGFHLIKRVE